MTDRPDMLPVSSARILIVDGTPPGGRILADLLQRLGYETDLAGSAREALLLAQTGRWDAVVLDVGLPDMNGVELYTQLHRGCGRECLPVIFVSGCTGRDLLRSLQAPSRRKPLGVASFLQALERSLQAGGQLSA